MRFGKLKEYSLPSAGKVISDLLPVLTIALVQLKGPHIIFLFLDVPCFPFKKNHINKQVPCLVSSPFPPGVTLMSPVAVTSEAAEAAGAGLKLLTWNALTLQHGNLPVHLI